MGEVYVLKAERGFITFTLVAYAALALAAVLVVGGLAWKAQTWCNHACRTAQSETKETRAERDALQAEKAAVLAREAAIANLYGEQVARTAHAEADRERIRNETFAPIIERVRALPPADAGVRVPSSVVGLLDDAARAANAAGTPAGASQTAQPAAAGADSTGGLVAGWFAIVAQIHAECRDRVAAWEQFYAGLRSATTEGVNLEAIH